MNPPSKRRSPLLPLANADAGASPDLLAVIKQESRV